MNLFFVYDTVYCKKDEDDPKDAVVYFFPVQASESQRYFLCCQLVGVAKFLRSTFSAPSVVVSDQGKFAFLWSGNYLLVLGANSDVNSSILKDQLSFLCGIFCFYHGSINNVLKACGNNREEFLSKMDLAWSRYITLSQCFGNVLQISLNALPLKSYKKNSQIVATANRLLHVCQLSSSVIAGIVFYNSRALSTQFMPQLTNYLSLLSNTNASAPVTNAFHILRNLPPDVELKYAYLNPKMISSIVKYNHTCVGSRIRVKSSSKQMASYSSTSKEHLSSGSEGDVDSGNCSESVHSNKDEGLIPPFSRKSKRYSSLKPSKQKKLCTISCCVGHSRLFEKNLYSSRNQSLILYLDSPIHKNGRNKVAERKSSEIHFKKIVESKQRQNSVYTAVNVLCKSHAHLGASSFVFKSKMQHSNLMSSNDLEFRCSLCTNYYNSTKLNDLSLKQWNSDINISSYAHHQCVCGHLTTKPCEGHYYSDRSDPVIENRIEVSKLQVLKCRSSSETGKRLYSTKRHSFSRRSTIDGLVSNNSKKILSGSQSFEFSFKSSDNDKHSNIESNELQKHVLYVQRYGSSTLVLLLNKTFDDKVINYLWNCGFTVLRELEYSSEKEMMEKSFNVEPSFYILLYNYVQKVLKEYPHFPSLLLSEKHSRKTLQQIQEDFQSDPHFKNMSLLSFNQSIFACQTDQNLAFYLQPEGDLRKLDPLYTISKKAVRRLAKYFKISL
ncbi:hypothetical protein TNIN_138081 [Trichonephila inaurata madagascariensis]|uniref:L27 domain-containing protein n=1 Tax=Trichonephila inaurata madagascariensis TaxID=2747483 RepID=A0A8X6YBM3_9ARAC|nr:hypothetical protein TNIN_138081 [Trichonephila inaurata madagascariensis]